MLQFKKAWLTSPMVILISILFGMIIGVYNKPLAEYLSPLGELYLALMGMCILPIIITAIISSLGKLLHTEYIAGVVKRLFIILISGLIISAVFGIVIALLVQPGAHLSGEAKELLSSKVVEQGTGSMLTIKSNGFLGFLLQVVPTNIFNALSQGNNLAAVFFSILLGIALGSITTEVSKKALDILHVIYTALLQIVNWVMYGLPIGLCFLFTGYASQISWEEVTALAKLLVLIYGGAGTLVLLCSILIWRQSSMGYIKSFAALRTPLLIAFGSCSSFAAIPAMINSLEQKLKLDRRVAELIIPLGVNLFRQGSILRFVIVALCIAQLYGQHLDFSQLSILMCAAMLASMAVSGVPGIASASIFALVLQPLGLPATIGVILFMTIMPITDPIITLLNVHGNCTLAMLMRGLQLPKEKTNTTTI